MTKLRETFLKKYGVWEYVLMVIGLLVAYGPVTYFIALDYDNASLEAVGLAVFVLLIAVLLVGRPLAIMDYGRKKLGLKTREEKSKEDA